MKKKIYLFSFLFLFIDQLSKIIVTNLLTYNKSYLIIDNFFYLMLVKNKGASFSILDGHVSFLIIVSFIALIIFVNYINKKVSFNKLEVLSYSLVLGGLVGNLIDRIFKSGVIDFLGFIIFGYDYPIFNFADIFIVSGIILLLFLEVKGEVK